MIHLSVIKFSVDFEKIYKRKNFSTPKNYLDFINNYMDFLNKNRTNIDNNVRRLEGGLSTLAKAEEDTKVLSEELAEKNAFIAEKKAAVEIMIADINSKTEVATKKETIAKEKK